MPAIGERRLSGRIVKCIPEDVKRFQGRSTMVVGNGASVVTVMERIIGCCGRGRIVWVNRRGLKDRRLYERIENDPLPQRDRLSVMANRMIGEGKEGEWELLHNYSDVKEISEGSDGKLKVTVGSEVLEVDDIVAATGYRPDAEV
jgi:hypothetical protein